LLLVLLLVFATVDDEVGFCVDDEVGFGDEEVEAAVVLLVLIFATAVLAMGEPVMEVVVNMALGL